MSITFNFLQAGSGDAILVSADHKNILIDGGQVYKLIKQPLKKIKEKNQHLDLVVLTHRDDDHIKGLLGLLEDKSNLKSLIKRIWFNFFPNANTYISDKKSGQTSAKQGIRFDKFVRQMQEKNDSLIYEDHISIEEFDSPMKLFSEVEITLLSPNEEKLQKLYKEYDTERSQSKTSAKASDYRYTIEELAQRKSKQDDSVTNGSSIAFILRYQKIFNFLLLADAHIDIIVNSLRNIGYSTTNPLKIDFVKLSHHGSKRNLNQEFLDILDTDTFIISTNGKAHNHPDKETLSKIIVHEYERDKTKKIKFLFNDEKNYNLFNNQVFTEREKNHYNFILKKIDKEKGLIFGENK
jgi:beta-lactamase superfamily II metal-dependent hydrolase